MTTKDGCLFLKNRYQPLVNSADHQSEQYSDLNLNQSSSKVSLNHSYSNSNNVASNPLESNFNGENSKTDGSFKSLDSKSVPYTDKDVTTKLKYKKPTAITSKNSTLSLHITAYENSIESVDSKTKTEEFGLAETWKIAKPNCIEKSFEFPRQQKDLETADSEVMQFKASQKLLNPNQSKVAEKDEHTISSMEASYRSVDETGNKAKEPGGSNYAYTREEMLRIKETSLAQERPAFLSVEFNDDKGLFAPDKWFDHTFAHDTHNKTVARAKKILNRGEEELGLSPQRRQFAGGCVPGSTNKTEQGNPKVWRNGKTGNRDDNKNEGNRWKYNRDGDKRDNRQRSHTSHTEELPEWMESKISVNDVIELKGFDTHNTEPSSQKPKEIPLSVPKYDELQLLQEIQRSDSTSSKSQPASGGSRFINFFKRNQESQQQESPLSFNSETVRKEVETPKSSNLNDLFGANQVWPEMPVSTGVLASDIEKRMHAVDIKGDSPTLLPELINTIRNPPEVHIKGLKSMNRSSELPKWEEGLIASLIPKHDVFIGKGKQQAKLSEEAKQIHHLSDLERVYHQNDGPNIHHQDDYQNIHHQDARETMPIKSVWNSKFTSDFVNRSKKDVDNNVHDEMIHGLNRVPDLSFCETDFPKKEKEESISPPHQPPPPHMYAETSGPSRSSPAPLPPSMLPPFGRMPYPNMPMPNNGMPPMMRFPFYPYPMMNPQMGPNGSPLHHPSSSQGSSSPVTHGGNLPTSVLLRMKSQNSSNTNSQRSPHSPDVIRRENNLSSPLITDMPQTSSHREGSVTNSDNESISNGPSSSNMFPRNPNNVDPMLYNMMMAQTMMNMQGMHAGMPGMPPPFPPNMPPFHGMPHMPPGMLPPFGAGVPPPFFPPGMPPQSDRPNSSSPMFEQVRPEQPSIPESILRQLPSSARPLTVADLERNLLSKN